MGQWIGLTPYLMGKWENLWFPVDLKFNGLVSAGKS
jgi:hypothetical protein